MDTFVTMRKYTSSNLIEQKYINNLVLEHETDIKLLQETFNRLNKNNSKLFFEGQIYDSYSLLIDIFNDANENVTIIDNEYLYHCGASLKDLGKKCFAITKIENKTWLNILNNYL